MSFGTGNKQKLAIVLVVVALGILTYLIFDNFFSTNTALERKMQESAAMLTSESPLLIDNDTRLDSVVAIKDQKLKYYYTLVNYTRDQINLDTVTKYIRPQIIENVKRSPDLEVFRQNEVSFDYIYADRTGDHVLTIEITPAIYQKN